MYEPSRPYGVTVPANQRLESGFQPNKLDHCVPMQQFAIQFTDDMGRRHVGIAIRIGEVWYMPPNGEAWASALQPLATDHPLVRQLVDSQTPGSGFQPGGVEIIP